METKSMKHLTDPSLFRELCYLNGKWLSSNDDTVVRVTNPSSGNLLGCVPNMGAAETADAILAAQNALPDWSRHTGKERAEILGRWFRLIVENTEDLALIMTLEQGKPLAESRGEIIYAASFIEWFSEEAKRVYGDIIPSHQRDKRIMVLKQPIGVTAAITPWNFPAAMITRKAAPALAAGCTMVVKPASETPFSALALAFLAEKAGLPAGVLSLVTGNSAAIGGELTSNPLVRKLSFTGSTTVGKLLMKQCSDTVKKVSMELGGNAPFLVFDDADLDAAVDGAMVSKYRNAGQTCVCANRIYVQDGIYDSFVAALAAKVNALKVGDGQVEGVTTGPLVDDKACLKVESHIADARSKGAKVITGGTRHELGGNFFAPTILSGVTQDMIVASEETFGPVAPIFRFSTEQEGVAMANASEFGLAAYFFTENIGRGWRVSEALEAGIVGLNTGLISTEVAPFGGVKESGVGREGSRYGIEDYCEIKYVCVGGVNQLG